MRLGRISFTTDYVVDLDNADMVAHAMSVIQEDLFGVYKDDSIEDYVHIEEDFTLTEEMIHEFLYEFHKVDEEE